MTGELAVRAALYTRVSTKDQATEGTSLTTQLARLRDHAEREGWHVVGEFADDGVSGDLPVADRPHASGLMDLCRRGGVDLVAVKDLDRFGRDVVETLTAERELERAGVAFVSVGEGLDTRRESDRLNLQLRAVIAEQEKRRMLERMSAGLRARAAAGDWPGGPAPYGFRLEAGPNGRKRPVVDDQEAEVLRRATALIVDDGCTTWTAAQTLNGLGLLPRTAKAWEHAHLRRTLMSPTLGGSWTYKAKTGPIEVQIPAILDPERQAALLDALNATSTGAGERSRPYPLTGRLVGPCGGAYHGIWRRDRGTRFYRCRNSRPEAKVQGVGCACRTVVADQVEALAWTEVTDILSRPERLLAMAEDYLDLAADSADATDAETTDSVDRKLTKLREARTTQVAAALKAGVDAAALAEAVAEIEREERALGAHRARLVAHRDRVAAADDRAAQLRDLAATAAVRLHSMDPSERRAVLDLLDVRVHVRGWRLCPTCDGKGKVKGGRGGLPCPSCAATRHVPDYELSGVVPEDVDVSHLSGASPRHRGPRRR